MRVEVSEAATADLDGIYDYGAEALGEAAADAYLRRFERAYALLANSGCGSACKRDAVGGVIGV